MKQEIVNYIDNFYNDFIANYDLIKKNTLDVISNQGYETFHWNTWWPESLLQYPSNRNLNFKVTENREDDHVGIHLYSKTDKKILEFFKKTTNNPILNSYYYENDYIRPSIIDESVNKDNIFNFATKYNNLVLIQYSQYSNHSYIFDEYKQIYLFVLDNDLLSNNLIIKNDNNSFILQKKLDKCVILLDKPFSINYNRKNNEIENKLFTFCFEFENYFE